MPVELPDGRGTYYPPRVPPSISGDHVYKTPGNPLMTGLFLPMRGTKDLFRIQLMNRGRVWLASFFNLCCRTLFRDEVCNHATITSHSVT